MAQDRSFAEAQDRLRAHVEALAGERHPLSAPVALGQAADYLSREFRTLGLETTEHTFEAHGNTFRNVIATMECHPAAAEAAPLVIAAHYDTVAGSPGADDNASGLAVMLEAAGSLRDRPLSRPIRFIAFCLEEEDLRGSRAYVSRLRQANQPLYGAVVLECVGYRSGESSQIAPPGIPIAVPTTGDFLAIVGNESSASLVAVLQTAAGQEVPDLRTIPLLVPGCGEALPDTRRSDHAAFWDHGYQAVMLTDTANFRNPHYHRPTDRIETLNFEFMVRVGQLVSSAAVDLAGQPSS